LPVGRGDPLTERSCARVRARLSCPGGSAMLLRSLPSFSCVDGAWPPASSLFLALCVSPSTSTVTFAALAARSARSRNSISVCGHDASLHAASCTSGLLLVGGGGGEGGHGGHGGCVGLSHWPGARADLQYLLRVIIKRARSQHRSVNLSLFRISVRILIWREVVRATWVAGTSLRHARAVGRGRGRGHGRWKRRAQRLGQAVPDRAAHTTCRHV
jgi:hypothetical protein